MCQSHLDNRERSINIKTFMLKKKSAFHQVYLYSSFLSSIDRPPLATHLQESKETLLTEQLENHSIFFIHSSKQHMIN